MDELPTEDSNLLTKRKFESVDVEEDGSIVKRSKAESQINSPPDEESEDYNNQHNLMHFSDDVMLYILHYCSPRELKALSFCCRRLARLCMDRSLWRMVELRQQAVGAHALTFYTHCLKSSTSSLYVRGLIGSESVKNDNVQDLNILQSGPSGCECTNPEHVSNTRRKWSAHSEFVSEPSNSNQQRANSNLNDSFEQGTSKNKVEKANVDNSSTSTNNSSNSNSEEKKTENKTILNVGTNSDQPGPSSFSSNQTVKESGNTSPKPFSSSYKDYNSHENNGNNGKSDLKTESQNKNKFDEIAECCKYRTVCLASITKNLMTEIRQRCINLQDLRLEYCNLNCNPFPVSYFPKTLKKLSLKGCKRTSVPFQKPYLFKIQDHLPELEELDLSFCRWLSGHSLLLLSKMTRLKKLWLRGCVGLGECVAYASLSTRFGFKALEVLDVRGTAMSDSEVSSFSFLTNLRELYLEPPFSNIDIDAPNGWPEHSGLMEPWELEHPCNEVDEYIDMMNKEELLCYSSTDCDPPENVKSSNEKSENRNIFDTQNTYAGNSQNDNGNDAHENVPGVFYRSVVNLSYEERNPDNGQNANANIHNNDEPPPAPPRRPVNPQANADNGVGVQVGPLGVQVGHVGVQVGPVGVQVGHAGVQVGPVRLQMRPAVRGDMAQLENGAQPGLGGVQVGPVEVQVGPEGVQVGLGEVRLDPGWARGPDGVQVELGGIRVDPRWMQIAPGVHVGFQGVELGPVEVQVGHERRPNQEDRNDEPAVHVGPIEVHLGPLRVEVGRDGRQNRPNQQNEERVNPENGGNHERQDNQPNVQRNMNDQNENNDDDNNENGYPNAPRRQNMELNLPPPGFWFDAFPVDPEPRLQIEFNVRRRDGLVLRRNRPQNQDRPQAQDPQQPQINNDQIPQVDNINPNVDNAQVNGAQLGDEQVNNREPANQRNVRQNPARAPCRHRGFMNLVRFGMGEHPGIHYRDRVFLSRVLRRHFNLPNLVQPDGGDRNAQNRQNNGNPANDVLRNEAQPNNDELREQNGQVEPEQAVLHGPAVAREFPRQARREINGRFEGQGRLDLMRREERLRINRPLRPRAFIRPSEQPRPNEPERPDPQPRADGPAQPNRQDRPEVHPRADRHNIMDGRVHVIYVNPQYPRRPAADVLVAAGLPLNADLHRNPGFMMINDGGNREDFELRNVQRVFDVQFPLIAPLQHLGGGDLVTDASLLHFGDSEHLIRVGGSQNGRQRYSPLEVLVCRGYRGVTDQSLAHLATAAPALRHLDVAGCGVTNAGAADFTMHRPNCKLHHHNDNDESTDRLGREPQQN